MGYPPRVGQAIIHGLPRQAQGWQADGPFLIVPVACVVLAGTVACSHEGNRGARHLQAPLIALGIGRLTAAVAILIIPHPSMILPLHALPYDRQGRPATRTFPHVHINTTYPSLARPRPSLDGIPTMGQRHRPSAQASPGTNSLRAISRHARQKSRNQGALQEAYIPLGARLLRQ